MSSPASGTHVSITFATHAVSPSDLSLKDSPFVFLRFLLPNLGQIPQNLVIIVILRVKLFLLLSSTKT